MPDKVLIRADASVRMGTGHVMRCISLAQGWRHAGGAAVFALAESTAALEQRLRTEGFDFERLNVPAGGGEDVAQSIALARRHGAAWVIADGYHFGADYQRGIKNAGLHLLFIDDNGHASHYSADIILNQNLHARTELYTHREPHTRLLLGTRYVLLRQQFLRYRGWQRETPAVARKVLVTLGGTDPDNVTGKAIERLRGLDVEAKIVVGGSNPHRAELESKIQNPKSKISLVVDAPDMPELMVWADVAITAGGTTCLEMCFLGLPACVLIIADNQAVSTQRLQETGAVFSLGRATDCSPDLMADALAGLMTDAHRRRGLSERGRALVDGCGAERVVMAVRGKTELI